MKKSGCIDCKYVDTKKDYKGWLVCKRNPPTAGPYTVNYVGVWPRVAEEDWCWQWTERKISEEEEEE